VVILGSVVRVLGLVVLGCLVFRLEFEFDVVAFDAYCVVGDVSWCRGAEDAAGSDVEDGIVPGAGHFCSHNHAFGEWSASMGTRVVNRVVSSGSVGASRESGKAGATANRNNEQPVRRAGTGAAGRSQAVCSRVRSVSRVEWKRRPRKSATTQATGGLRSSARRVVLDLAEWIAPKWDAVLRSFA
jgi:hypothetical protein